MGIRKRPKFYIGTLPDGSEYYYFRKPISSPPKKPAAPRSSKKISPSTSKKSALTKARERKVKLG